MNPEKIKQNLGTKETITWCPGCPNFMILESVKQAITQLNLEDQEEYKQEKFAITTDIGCNSKIYDYLNLSGIYGLHGRALPNALGIKLGNPSLHTLCFVGDGGLYSEGISHLIHSCKYNSNLTCIVHDNQSFSLTTGQPTPTSQQGYKSKASPLGVKDTPLNPIKLVLSSGATFVARCNAKDIKHTAEILKKAIQHKGFSFVEIIQDCLVFNPEANNKDKQMYKIKPNTNLKQAYELADKWDYNKKTGKIALGILYQKEQETMEEKYPLLKELLNNKTSWKDWKK